MDQEKLREWEYKCIQEEPPECAAACPIHVDARLFVKEMARGDREAAYKVLAKTMPFPGILGRICDHPCESKCKRGEVEEPIAIGLLERSCVEQAAGKGRIQVLSRREQRIAVLGGGFAGLVAAWDLLKKGFKVTVFEGSGRLGGSLWELPEGLLPREVLCDELATLEALKAEIRLDQQLDAAAFEAICREFDALFIDRESLAGVALPLALEDDGMLAVDAATGATDRGGVFAGGGTGTRGAYAPVSEALQGRKGALSIERFIQKAQMGAGRENEGPFQTRLFTSTEGVEPEPRVAPSDAAGGFSDEEARAEASRCIQCECMECVKVCLYLERYQGYPKKYARQVFNNDGVIFGAAHTKNQFVNSCSGCGLCETVCPNNFNMGDLCHEARRTMNEHKFMPASFHEFALQDLEHSRGERFALGRHEPGREQSAWLYFPSCQLCATSPGEVDSSYRYLRRELSGGVGMLLGCCGAPAYWAGRDDLFREALGEVRSAWQKLGSPKVVTACSTCQSIFSEHLPEMESVSLWKIVEEKGLPASNCCCEGAGKSLSISDPCITRHDPQTRQSVRRIVRQLGYAIDELPLSGDKPECCGYGGLMFNANPKLAKDVIGHRAAQKKPAESAIAQKPVTPPGGWYRTRAMQDRDTVYYRTQVSGNDYLAYCAMCRDNLAAAGKRVSHLVELLFPQVAGGDPAARGWISWSERRANRGRVRGAVLRELGEEGVVTRPDHEKIVLRIAPEVLRRIDERRILEDDVKKVIYHAERSGKRLQDLKTGCLRASLQCENVTFWVDYTSGADGFTVHNAYCHRMKIVGIKK